jgi:hypothetical protein
VEDAEARHALGDDPAEAVGVDVEEGEVGEQAQLRGQVPGTENKIYIPGCNADDAVCRSRRRCRSSWR